jgi:hypothetical protein
MDFVHAYFQPQLNLLDYFSALTFIVSDLLFMFGIPTILQNIIFQMADALIILGKVVNGRCQ